MTSLSSTYSESVDGISQKMYAGKRRRRPVKRNPTHNVVEVKSNPSKRHRDRLNAELDRLASLLPFDADTISKLDKLSILRLSVSFLRSKSYFNVSVSNKETPNGAITDGSIGHRRMLPSVDAAVDNKMDFEQPDSSSSRGGLSLEGEAEMLVQAMNGFLLVVQQDGQVMFASPSIQEYLGFQDADVMHQCVYDLIHKDDRTTFQQQLKYENCHDYVDDVESPDSKISLERNFTARLRCLLDESSGFLNLQITGRLRPLYGQRIRGEDGVPVDVDPPEMALFAIVCPMQQPSIMEIYVRNMIFRTKHQLNFKPITLDSKAADILGYNETQFKTVAGYHYLHYEDIIYCSEMHSSLVRKGESGFIYFRLLTKTYKWLWVQAKGRVIYKSGKPDYLVSTHRPMSDEEGDQHLTARGEPFKFPFSGTADLYNCNPPYPPIPIPKSILEGRSKFPANFPPFTGNGPPPGFPAGGMPPGFPAFPGDGPPPGFPPFPGDRPPSGFPPGGPPPGFEGSIPQMPAGVDLPGLSSPASRQIERRPKLVAKRQLTKPPHGTPPPNVTVNPANGTIDFNPTFRLPPTVSSSSSSGPSVQMPQPLVQPCSTPSWPHRTAAQQEQLKQELRKFTQAFQKVSMREEANAKAMANRDRAAQSNVQQATAAPQQAPGVNSFSDLADPMAGMTGFNSHDLQLAMNSNLVNLDSLNSDMSESVDFDSEWIVLKTSPQSVNEDYSQSCAMTSTVPSSCRSGASTKPFPSQQNMTDTSSQHTVSYTPSTSSSFTPRNASTTNPLSHQSPVQQQSVFPQPQQNNPLEMELISLDRGIPSFDESLAPITFDELIPSLTPNKNTQTNMQPFDRVTNTDFGCEPQTCEVRPILRVKPMQQLSSQESDAPSMCAGQQAPLSNPFPQSGNSPRIPPASNPGDVFNSSHDSSTILDFGSLSEGSSGIGQRQESMSTTSLSSPASVIDNDSVVRINWPPEQGVSSPPDIKYPLTDEQLIACATSLSQQNGFPQIMSGIPKLNGLSPLGQPHHRHSNHHSLPQQQQQYRQPHNMGSPRQAFAPDNTAFGRLHTPQQALIQESLTEQNFIKREQILQPGLNNKTNLQQQSLRTLTNRHILPPAYPGVLGSSMENGFPSEVNGYDGFTDISQDVRTIPGQFDVGLDGNQETFILPEEFENTSGNYADTSVAFQKQQEQLLLQQQQLQQKQQLLHQQRQQLEQRQFQQQQQLSYVPNFLDITTTPEQLFLNGVP